MLAHRALQRLAAPSLLSRCMTHRPPLVRFSDEYFKKAEKVRSKKNEEGFFAEQPKKEALPKAYIDNQKALDTALMAKIDKVPMLKNYLGNRFTLKSGDRPHLMAF